MNHRNSARTIAFAVALTAILPACSLFAHSSTWVVAVGARGTVSNEYGPCDATRAESPGGAVTVSGGERVTYSANAPGRVRVPCRDGSVVIVARAPARIAIDVPERVTLGAKTYASVRAFDAEGHDLDLGSEPGVVWSTDASLEEASRYSDMPIFGTPSPASFAFISRAPGRANLTATRGGMTVTVTLTVDGVGAGAGAGTTGR